AADDRKPPRRARLQRHRVVLYSVGRRAGASAPGSARRLARFSNRRNASPWTFVLGRWSVLWSKVHGPRPRRIGTRDEAPRTDQALRPKDEGRSYGETQTALKPVLYPDFDRSSRRNHVE